MANANMLILILISALQSAVASQPASQAGSGPATAPATAVLAPGAVLDGHVVDAVGQPVTKFEVYAGPGDEPLDRDCAHAVVADSSGYFRLQVKERGTAWIGIKAPGYAFWETHEGTARNDVTLTARLEPGTVVQGTAKTPKTAYGPVHVKLVPQLKTTYSLDGKVPVRQRLGAAETLVTADGTFRLEGVLPGRHSLVFYGQGVTTESSWVSIPEGPTTLPPVTLEGTGSIFGTVSRQTKDGKRYASAKGVVACTWTYGLLEGWDGGNDDFAPRNPIHFKLDADGHFRVNDVPVGQTSVTFYLKDNEDYEDAVCRAINVVEGKPTEVRVSDGDSPWSLPIRVVVGDGSDKHWQSGTASASPHKNKSDEENEDEDVRGKFFLEFAVRPLSDEPLSYPEQRGLAVVQNGTVNLPDVHPGRYKLLAFDSGSCISATVETTPKTSPVVLHLEAGSVTGIIRESFINPEHRVTLWILSETNPKYAREIECNYDGSFAFRFVPPGTYSLYSHDTEFGYCRVSPFRVADQMVDVGALKLKPGGTLSVHVSLSPDKPLPNNMCAAYLDRIEIPLYRWPSGARESGTMTFRNLWPGEWTVLLFGDQGTLASGQATLKDEGDASVELKWK